MSFGARFGQLVRRYRELEEKSAKELALAAFGDEAKRSRISELENGKVANPQAKTIYALCKVLGISPEEVEACRKPPTKDVGQAQADLDQLRDERGSLTAALDAVRDLSRSQLETLARRFDIDQPEAMRDGDISALLEKKAAEYRAYKTQIDNIDERVAGLGNLKAAAQEAAERLDFEEVENLLSMVHTTELEIAWDTASLRADNALLRGRTKDAFTIISAAADAFAAIDPIEPAQRRIASEDRLFQHGLRYGSNGILLSEEMLCTAIEHLSEEDHRHILAGAQNRLGIALRERAARTNKKGRVEILTRAVNAFEAALIVVTETDYPHYWAFTKSNLGAALQERGLQVGGWEGLNQIADGVNAFRASVGVFNISTEPDEHAGMLNNLGNGLINESRNTKGKRGSELLAEAIDVFRTALSIRADLATPLRWAMTQDNLGNALSYQGSRTGGEEGAKLLAEAVTAYLATLRVYTEAEHPVQWAITQNNLAIAELAIADHETCADPRSHLEAALAHVGKALQVFDPEHMPYNFEKATRLRDSIAAKLAAFE